MAIRRVVVARQVTLRGIGDQLDRTLRLEAQRRKQSLNQTVLDLLAEATGLADAAEPGAGAPVRFHDLDQFAGTWTADDAREFDEHLRASRRVDDELWR